MSFIRETPDNVTMSRCRRVPRHHKTSILKKQQPVLVDVCGLVWFFCFSAFRLSPSNFFTIPKKRKG